MKLWVVSGVTPIPVKEPLSDAEHKLGRSHVLHMFETHVHALTDDTGLACDRWADNVGTRDQDGVVVEVGG